MISDQPGTYVLVLRCQKPEVVRVGGLGELLLKPGHYLYVGSAFGPGGLRARIEHHSRIAFRPHWHIDYLRAQCELVEVWTTNRSRLQEHIWARSLSKVPGVEVPMPRFGSSDCSCPTHLFWFPVDACRTTVLDGHSLPIYP